MHTTAQRRARRAIGPLLVLLVWWIGSRSGWLDERFFSSPSAVAHVFATEATASSPQDNLWHNLQVSLGRVALGLALGVGAGVALGCLTAMSRHLEDLLDPVLQGLRTVPIVALSALFVVWFGIGETPKIVLVAVACFFPMYLNVYNGIRNVDARLVEAARGFGVGRRGLVQDVVLPGALPQALLGLRYALGISWLALVLAEQINASSGIGYLLGTAETNLDTAGVVAGITTYAALGILTDAFVRMLEDRLLRWRNVYAGA